MSEWISSKIEHLQKAVLYFKGPDSYFGPSDRFAIKDEFKDKTSDYPIEFASLIDGIHFRNFDENGVPVRLANGQKIYSFSRIISYGTGELQNFLRTGNETSLNHVKTQVDYVLKKTEKHEHGYLLRAFDVETKRHSGALSAMDQGQAVSLLLRYAQITEDENLLAELKYFFRPFDFAWNDNGVSFRLDEDSLWYEEYPKIPLLHTLNGGLFALIGLHDLAPYDSHVKDLFEKGIRGLASLLPKFDTGYWSFYYIPSSLPETNVPSAYIASMKYHALHVLQLKILSEASRDPVVASYHERFDNYQSKAANRLWAAANMTRRKLLRDYK